MKRSTYVHARWLLAAAASLLAAACAQSNGDINRVQPNVLKKADLLDGTWFFRNTVTQTPFNTQFTYPGQTGNMEKLVWEIQEKYLVGYRSYPYSPGTEANVDPSSIVSGTTAKYCDAAGVCTGGQKYYGSPVVAYMIESHFDIQRGYNTATGEQTNVISENASDRPWNQREYFRVNWAMNMLNQASGLNWGTVQNPASGASSSNWVQPNEPGSDPYDWPAFEYAEGKDGQKHLSYFDVTGRYIANPDTMYFDGYGNIPLCWFARGVYDCASSEIKIRTSIMKVDTNWARNYEPLVYPNDLMSLFGYFRTERLNYDRKFGYVDSAVIRLGNRHRIWENYFTLDANGEPDVTKPIPLADRTPKPIVYYFTPAEKMGGQDRYDEFMEPGRILEQEYDRAFRQAVGAAQGKATVDTQMFHLCNNPVRVGDPAPCGAAGFTARVGDLRRSFVNTVAEPVANGLLGYGPSSADPETGQIISGMSNTYLWGVDLEGRQVTDWILLLEGEKTLTSYISGDDVKKFIDSHKNYNVASLDKSVSMVKSELQNVVQRSDETKGAFDRQTDRLAASMSQLKTSGGLPVAARDDLAAAAEQLKAHPELEATLLDNPDVQADLANLLPPFAQERAKTDATFRRMASRSVLTNITQSQAWNQARLNWVAKNNVYLAEFFDHSLYGLADQKIQWRRDRVAALKLVGKTCQATSECGFASTCVSSSAGQVCKKNVCADIVCTETEAKVAADDEIAREVRQQIWLWTTLHEAGHTLNLRHNFQGSYDALNYPSAYWDRRKDSITVAQGPNNDKKLPRTPGDVKRALDGTETQQLERMYDYQYSTVMDYIGNSGPGSWTWEGDPDPMHTGGHKRLGRYDEAAIMFAYSGSSEPQFAYDGEPAGTGAAHPGFIETFKTARKDSKSFPGSDGSMMTISGAGADLPMVNAVHLNPNVRNYTERFHYSTLPLHFGEGSDLDSVITDGLRKMKDRQWVKYAELRKDEAKVASALKSDPTLMNDPDRAAGVLGTPMLRVPYMFCSDDSVQGPILSCNMFDRGPDYYEMVKTHLEEYWAYYFDSHYRRGSAFFSGNGAVNSAYSTFMFSADTYKHWVLELYGHSSRNQEQAARPTLDPIMQDMWTIAVLDGLNSHLNVMSVPPYGMFMYRNLASGPRWDLVSEGEDYDTLNSTGRTKLQDFYTQYYGAKAFSDLSRGNGRRMYSRYDFKSGFGFFNRMEEAGHYNDQLGAMFAAVIPELQVQGVDVTADQNRYNIPYYLIFKKEMTDTFGALWSQNEDKVRPVLYKTLNPAGQVQEATALDWRVYVRGSELFQGFDYPTPLRKDCQAGERPPSCYITDQLAAPANIQLTWTSRLYSLYLGEALFRTNFDLDYAKANQVYKLGGQEQFTVATGFHTVEVPDIITGSRYVAVVKDGVTDPSSTAATRMIYLTNIYLDMVNNPGKCPLDDYLTVAGYTCMPAASANNPALLAERRQYWLEIYQDSLRDLDLMRGFYSVFGRAF